MSNSINIGVSNIAKQVKNVYLGVENVARKVKKGWIGVDGKARLFYSSELPNLDCLCFTANQSNSTIQIITSGTLTREVNFEYLDYTGYWKVFTPNSTTITLRDAGDRVYFRGNNSEGISEGQNNYYKFVLTGSIAASGNIMSLIDNGECSTYTIPCNYCFSKLFNSATSLTTAPDLPAITLKSGAYFAMFEDCSALTTPPMLLAKSIPNNGYAYMFKKCSSLVLPPEIAATEITGTYACYSMFASCSALKVAPRLHSTTLSQYCYAEMFNSCSSLLLPPFLNAPTFVENCYDSMFYKCSHLYLVPTILGYNNTNITQCMYSMFNSCSILWIAESSSTSTPEDWYLPSETTTYTATKTSMGNYIFTGCPGTRTTNDFTTTAGENKHLYTYTTPISSNLLCFVANEGGSTIRLNLTGTTTLTHGFTYKILDEAWETLIPNSTTITLTNAGDWVLIKGTNTNGVCESSSVYYTFAMTGSINASGSIMSLIDNGAGTCVEIPNAYCFANIFQNCTSLKVPPYLPATTLKAACYYKMFEGCSNLLYTPELPATTLDDWCYAIMFRYCSSLVTVSELPATTLNAACYYKMFEGCTSLITTPLLPAVSLNQMCYQDMFYNCTSLITISSLPARQLATDCYKEMFYGCSKLYISESETRLCSTEWRLPLGGLYQGTYSQTDMFKGCLGSRSTDTMPGGSNKSYTYYTQNAFLGNYLRFTANTAQSTVTLNIIGTPTLGQKFYYSFNTNTWVEYTPGTTGAITMTIKGTAVYFKGDNPSGVSQSTSIYYYFSMSGSISASGNIMSLIDNGTGNTFTIPNNYCFYKLLYYCTSLTTAPELPATTLKTCCYTGMFIGCTSLTTAPSLPATTLYAYCYDMMFYGCTKLTTAPALPATTLANYCYHDMFNGCTSLETAPVLPATTLTISCYNSMFNGCTKLATAPALPATTLANSCYAIMFKDCTSLTKAPALPGNSLVTNCYNSMFNGCTSLIVSDSDVGYAAWRIPLGGLFTQSSDLTMTNMFYNCSVGSGSRSSNNLVATSQTYKTYYTQNSPVEPGYLCFTAIAAGSTIKIDTDAIPETTPSLEFYNTGDITITTWTTYSIGTIITLTNIGDKVYFRGNNPNGFSESAYLYYTFKIIGKVSSAGNIMSLINMGGNITTIPCDYCFYRLFSECSGLTIAPTLSATILTEHCYDSMFHECTRLTIAPALPATTLADYCYYGMFEGCENLTTAPALPATTLASHCYHKMFGGCENLTTAPALSATTLTSHCYNGMFRSCTNLTTAPNLLAPILADSCYYQMFYRCSSLTTTPSLTTATILADHCYDSMFEGCTGLTIASALPTTNLKDYCYSNMFKDCTSLTTAPTFEVTTAAENCCYSMFNGCTSLSIVTNITLSAKILCEYCYAYMFNGCTQINIPPTINAEILEYGSCEGMFYGCTSLSTAPSLSATTLAEYCYANMFFNCSSLQTVPKLPATFLPNNCYFNMFHTCSSLIVSDNSTIEATKSWNIPQNNSSIMNFSVSNMFYGCNGSRQSNNFSVKEGHSCLYYTQNEPV